MKADKNTLPTDKMGNGPVQDRSCTDILCCLVFVAFIVGMVGTSGYGFLYGKPELLLTAWDADGNGCGYNATTKDYPYLYFPSIDLESLKNATNDPSMESVTEVLRYSMCVKECPKGIEEETINCKMPKAFSNILGYFDQCVFLIEKYYEFRYPTILFANSYCVPDLSASLESNTTNIVKEFKKEFDKYIGASGIQTHISDIMATSEPLLIAFGTAFLIGFIYMILLRLVGGLIIYSSILLMILGTAYGGYMLFETSNGMPDEDQYKQYYLIGSYVVWGIAGLLLCCVLFN